MLKMKVDVKVIEEGKIPTKASDRAACYDMYVREIEETGDPNLIKVKLGVAIQPPPGYRVAIYPRSSISKTVWMLANSVGVGDNDYTGEYLAYFRRVNDKDTIREGFVAHHIDIRFPYKVGERCCQMEVIPYYDIEFNKVAKLKETARGEGGYGSTGKKELPTKIKDHMAYTAPKWIASISGAITTPNKPLLNTVNDGPKGLKGLTRNEYINIKLIEAAKALKEAQKVFSWGGRKMRKDSAFRKAMHYLSILHLAFSIALGVDTNSELFSDYEPFVDSEDTGPEGPEN